jgi:hypothetical protein
MYIQTVCAYVCAFTYQEHSWCCIVSVSEEWGRGGAEAVSGVTQVILQQTK